MTETIDLTGFEDDTELQKAIQMSLQEGVQQSTHSAPAQTLTTTEEEQQIARAIAASVGDNTMAIDSTPTTTQFASNPELMKRNVDGIELAGLFNVGNTCYVNALLQIYYMIPSLQKAVLSFSDQNEVPEPIAPEAMDTGADTANTLPVDSSQMTSVKSLRPDSKKDKIYSIEFVKALQQLYTFLALSDYKVINTQICLSCLKDMNGRVWQVGNQEDISELNDLFLHRLETGIGSVTIHNLFYGKSSVLIEAYEEDKTNVTTVKEESFTNLGLPLQINDSNATMLSIYDLLERSLVDEAVEYTTPKNYRIENARKTVWLKEIPPVLMLLVGRVTFDKATKQSHKVQAPVAMEPTIYLDRFVEKNREATEQIRLCIYELRKHLRAVQDELNSIKNYRNRGYGLDDALDSVSDYFFSLHQSLQENATRDSQQMEVLTRTIQFVQSNFEKICSNVKTLMAKQDDIQHRINTAFDLVYGDEQYRQHCYHLHAVVMHSGTSANSGHYWAYVRDYAVKESTAWIKFNDTEVTRVDNDIVQKEAASGYVYCLFYMDTSRCSPEPLTIEQLKSIIPEKLLTMVTTENNILATQIENFKNRAITFVKSFKEYQNMYKEQAKNPIKNNNVFECDHRLRNIFTFAYSLDLIELADSMVLYEIYRHFYGRTIKEDFDDQTQDIKDVQKHLNDDALLERAIKIDTESKDIKELMDEFRRFRFIAQATLNALSFMLDPSTLVQALHCWAYAIDQQRKLKHKKLESTNIANMFDFTAWVLYTQGLPYIQIQQQEANYAPVIETVFKAALTFGSPQLIKFFFNDFTIGNFNYLNVRMKDRFRALSDHIRTRSNGTSQIYNLWKYDLTQVILINNMSEDDYGRLISQRQQTFKQVDHHYANTGEREEFRTSVLKNK